MNNKQEYEYFYNKYYSHFEKLIKRFLIVEKNKKKNGNFVYNELVNYLSIAFHNKIDLTTNLNLKNFLSIFEKGIIKYEDDQINLVFENEIKPNFDKIGLSVLPLSYTIRKLLIEIALVNIANEISRLLQSNRNLFNLFYAIGEFKEFEIKEYAGLSVEDTEIFKSLNQQLYPDYYTNRILQNDTDEDKFYENNTKPNKSKTHDLPISIAMLYEIGFFELEKIKNLSPNNQAKIIAFIQQKDIENSNIQRAISGNIRVLFPDSNKEDGLRYTSHKHLEKVKLLLNTIKLGNK